MAPEQLVSINPNRPVLKLRLSPRKRVVVAAPGGGGTPPPGGTTENNTRSMQPLGEDHQGL